MSFDDIIIRVQIWKFSEMNNKHDANFDYVRKFKRQQIPQCVRPIGEFVRYGNLIYPKCHFVASRAKVGFLLYNIDMLSFKSSNAPDQGTCTLLIGTTSPRLFRIEKGSL